MLKGKGQVLSSTQSTTQLLKKSRLRCNAYNVISLQETNICLVCNVKRQILAECRSPSKSWSQTSNNTFATTSYYSFYPSTFKTSKNVNNIHWKQIPISKKQYQKQCSSTTAILSLLFIPWFQLEHAISILNRFLKRRAHPQSQGLKFEI